MKTPQKDRGPVTNVRVGSVTIPIYRDTSGCYTADWTVGDKRMRKRGMDFKKVEKHAKQQAALMSKGEKAALNFNAGDLDRLKAHDMIAAPTGETAEMGLRVYAEMKRIAGKRDPFALFMEGVKRSPEGGVPMTVGQVIPEYVNSKKNGGRNLVYVQNMETLLGRFAESFGKAEIGTITGKEISDWLGAVRNRGDKKPSPRTIGNHFLLLRGFFRYAMVRKYLPRDWDELSWILRPAFGPGKVEVFSPEEVAKIIAYAEVHHPDWVLFFALRAFSGLRSYETTRLTPKDFRGDFIVCQWQNAKKQQERTVPITPTLAEFLLRYPPTLKRLKPVERGLFPKMTLIIRKAGVRTRHNGFRDSYISYRIASRFPVSIPIHEVAEECGNSVGQIRRSYKSIRLPNGDPITPEVAAAYFAIKPGICHETVTGKVWCA